MDRTRQPSVPRVLRAGGRHVGNGVDQPARAPLHLLPASNKANLMDDTNGLHRSLIRALKRLHLDRESSPSPTHWSQLLELLSTTFTEIDDEHCAMRRSIDQASRELGSLHEALSRQALQDTLTGLPNRAALIRHLEQSLAECARAGDGL